MFNELLNKLGEFWIADDEEHKIPGVLDQNTNSYEISFVNVNFNSMMKIIYCSMELLKIKN